MATYLTNALSLNQYNSVIDSGQRFLLNVEPISQEMAAEFLTVYDPNFVSAIGHSDTAVIVSSLLGIEVTANRIKIDLQPQDTMIVAQYLGPRLPEGCTELPEGSGIKFLRVQIL
jgi:hypothetical protein